MVAVIRLRQSWTNRAQKEADDGNTKTVAEWAVAPVVSLAVYEALAHTNFFTTGHRGLVQTGTWLKCAMDTLDAASHGLLAATSPMLALSSVHVLLFGWHCAKATDSQIIDGYSPMRGLWLPNLIDTSAYCISALHGAYVCPEWALFGAIVYSAFRFHNCIY